MSEVLENEISTDIVGLKVKSKNEIDGETY